MSAPAGVRLLGAGDIRALASRLGVRPTKKLGQNFVVEPGTVRQIAALAGPLGADDLILEIGPGLGSLTLALLEAAAPAGARVAAVEIDPVLAAELPKTIADRAPGLAERVAVIQADALTLGTSRAAGSARRSERRRASTGADEAEPGERRGPHGEASWYGDQAQRVWGPEGWPVPPGILAANLPYNVAVPVVLHLLATFPSLRSGVVMVQAEVADRMCAGPGSRVYGAPSAKLAWYATARPAGTVPRSVFWPVPNVDSKLVAFTRHEPLAVDASREQVFAVIDAAFGQRRKTLRAALGTWAGSPAAAEAVLRAAGVDPGARGESLSIAEFARIAAAARAAELER